MKTYISDIIPKLQRFSRKLDDLTYLTNQHWVVVDDINNIKSVYIFRTNNQLLISNNGKVSKANWEYLGNNSILIDKNDESYLFKHGFLDENILALKS
jgi:hemin uptake protein HemP